MPRIVAAMFEDFEDYNNPIQEFVKNYPIKDRIVSDVYKDYQEYCGKNGYKPWGKNLFGSELKYFGFISKRKYNSSLKKYEYIYYEANE